jgi:hypothetical protein
MKDSPKGLVKYYIRSWFCALDYLPGFIHASSATLLLSLDVGALFCLTFHTYIPCLHSMIVCVRHSGWTFLSVYLSIFHLFSLGPQFCESWGKIVRLISIIFTRRLLGVMRSFGWGLALFSSHSKSPNHLGNTSWVFRPRSSHCHYFPATYFVSDRSQDLTFGAKFLGSLAAVIVYIEPCHHPV